MVTDLTITIITGLITIMAGIIHILITIMVHTGMDIIMGIMIIIIITQGIIVMYITDTGTLVLRILIIQEAEVDRMLLLRPLAVLREIRIRLVHELPHQGVQVQRHPEVI